MVYAANGLVSNAFARFVDCAALVGLFTLLQGRELKLGDGFAVARRALLPLILLGLLYLGIDLAGRLLDALIVPGAGILVTLPGLIFLPFALMFVVAILAEHGGGFGAAVADSWLLVRLTWRDVVLGIIFLGVLSVIVAAIALFVLVPALNVGPSDLASTPGLIGTAIITIPISAFGAAYTARLYLFARSVEAADERREGAAD